MNRITKKVRKLALSRRRTLHYRLGVWLNMTGVCHFCNTQPTHYCLETDDMAILYCSNCAKAVSAIFGEPPALQAQAVLQQQRDHWGPRP